MSTSPSRQTGTAAREKRKYAHLDRDHWTAFFDDFSRRHLGIPLTMEVETPDIGSHELARNAPLVGITASAEHGPETTIELIFGPGPTGNASHTIQRPTRVTLGPEDADPRWIEIEAAEGQVLTIRWQEPAGKGASCDSPADAK